jgi:hypothetical protein
MVVVVGTPVWVMAVPFVAMEEYEYVRGWAT